MALLYPQTYFEPGTYMQVTGSKSNVPEDEIMLPVVIGQGSRFIRLSEKIVRGYVYQEPVKVSVLYPNNFTTKYPFVKDKKKIVVYKESTIVSPKYWEIVDEQTIQVLDYTPDSDYFVDYQSSLDVVDDKVNLDLVRFESVGNSYSSSEYTEFKNFYLKYLLDNVTLNKEKSDVLSFPEAYTSDYDYPIISDYSLNDLIDIVATKVEEDILNVVGKVVRLDLNHDGSVKFIWLKLTANDSYTTILEIVNDGNYYSWNGLDFKLVGSAFKAELVTESGLVLRKDEDPTTFTFKALPSKILIAGPARTITAKILDKGELLYNKSLENIETTELQGNYFLTILDESSNVSKHYTLKVITLLEDEGNLNLVIQVDNGNDKMLFYAPAIVEEGNIHLKEDYSFVTEDGIKIDLFPMVQFGMQTEYGEFISDEQSRLLFAETSGKVTFNIGHTILEFDYVCDNQSTPTNLLVTDTYSNKNSTLQIVDDGYYLYDGIKAKINLDLVEKDDIVQFDVDKEQFISWNLTEDKEEVFTSTIVDYSGTLNGKFATIYVKLSSVPIDGVEVECDEIFDHDLIIKDGSAFVVFTRNTLPYTPKHPITISYRTRVSQPKVGATYYVVATCVRPDSMYNTLIDVTSVDEGRELIGPFETSNDLYLANEIAWREFTQGDKYAYLQIKDSDGDGVITKHDVEVALQSLAKFKRGTDLVLLNQFDYIGLMVNFGIEQNDPFQVNENKIWVGFPRNTPIEDKITFSSNFEPLSFADFRVLVGNDEATLSVDTIPITKKVDGSFIAWDFVCKRRTSTTEFASSLVRSELVAFDDIATFDISGMRQLGANNIAYITKEAGSYLILEDLTNSGNIEQVIDQQIFVSRMVRMKMKPLVGTTFDTTSQAIYAIKSSLICILKELIKDGYISPYLDANGKQREIEPALDVFVKQVENNKTQYQFGFGFYTKKGIKHLFGSYIIDRSWN